MMRPTEIISSTVYGGVRHTLEHFPASMAHGRYSQDNWLICDDVGSLYAFTSADAAAHHWRGFAGIEGRVAA